MSNSVAALEAMNPLVGQTQGTGDWFTVTQDQINQFAAVTVDHQYIHIDPERAAAESPFGGTIAHGFLTLSMLTHLQESIEGDPWRREGLVMFLNYGFDKIRFINPVPTGARIRASAVLSKAELKGMSLQTTRTMTVEIDGAAKPALVAEWIDRAVYDS